MDTSTDLSRFIFSLEHGGGGRMEAALRAGPDAFCKMTSDFDSSPHGPAVATLSGSRSGGNPWESSDCWFREPRPVHPLGGGKTMMALECARLLESSITSVKLCTTCSNFRLHSLRNAQNRTHSRRESCF